MGVDGTRRARQAVVALAASALIGCAHHIPDSKLGGAVQFDRSLILNNHELDVHLASKPGAAAPFMVIYVTGDGGWRGKDLAVYGKLASWGYPTAGFSAPEYLKHLSGRSDTTTPVRLARDYGAIIAMARTALGLPAQTPIVLVGVSRGADLAVIAAGQESIRRQLCGVVAVALTKEEEYVRWYRRLNIGIGGAPVRLPEMLELYDYLPRLGPLPLSVIQSTHDKYLAADKARELFGPDTERRQLHPIVARDHSFTDARPELYDVLDQSLRWVASLEAERRVAR